MRELSYYIKEPRNLLRSLQCHFPYLFTNKSIIISDYWAGMGTTPNLKNPTTFQEKIQWLKLNNRIPSYRKYVDKIEVKDVVSQIIGEQYIIPTLAVWDSIDDINFDSLPQKFVIKNNHSASAAGVVIVKDKRTIDWQSCLQQLRKDYNYDIYYNHREWVYKGINKRTFIEPLLETKDGSELNDYKFYCFNGEPKYCQVIGSRFTQETIDFFDMEWNHMPFYGLNPAARPAARPAAYDEMIHIAAKLSKNIPFVRVDLYNVDGKIYFGEMTFYPGSGIGVFQPQEWNKKLGDLIVLPK